MFIITCMRSLSRPAIGKIDYRALEERAAKEYKGE